MLKTTLLNSVVQICPKDSSSLQFMCLMMYIDRQLFVLIVTIFNDKQIVRDLIALNYTHTERQRQR